jgi:serine/threonine-protein kinase
LGVFPVRAVMLEALRSVALAVGVLLLAALLGAGAWALYTQAEHGLEGQPAKVAKSEEPLEAWTGADSFLTPSPAPLLATMAHSPASPANLEVTSALPASRKGLRARAAEKCVTAACCAVLGACGANTPQVRPTPKPEVRPTPKLEACPANALSTMKELGIRIDERAMGHFPVVGSVKPVPVKEFTPFELVTELGALQAGTVVSGRLIFGTDRVYGRFTQARTLKGKTYPVCLELHYGGKRGVEIIRDGESASAVVLSTADVVAVERFE